MQQSAGPGDLLADRYLLVDLLTESGNGRFWRAHDRVLERHVALHCLAEDDERAAALTEAARVSATVLDRRILRVLDADSSDGIAYVVNEWGSGTSLDILVAGQGEGPLPPRRAAWLVSEVAASMAVAHEQRVAHGRLVPENVLVDQTGQVKVIGFCVDAALLGLPAGRVTQDVADLGGLLYFLLTGKWAGPSESGVPAAMRDHGRWLRPRQVRARIPRVLDTICDQVLNPYSAEPGHSEKNLHTARGLAEALADYVGDPTGMIQPAPVNGISGGGVLAVPERRAPAPRETEPQPPEVHAEPQPEPQPEPETEPEPEPTPEPDPTVALSVPPPVIPPSPSPEADATPPATLGSPDEPHADDQSPVSTPASPVDMPTQAGMPIFDDEADEVSWLAKRAERPPPPPDFEDPPERPLFAPTPAEGQPARTPRPGAAAPATGEYWPWENTGPGTGSGVIPVTETGLEEDDEVPGRSWFRLAVLIALALLLLVGVVVAYNLGMGKSPLGADPEPESPSSPTAGRDEVELTPISGTTATDLDPQGEPPEEYPELAELAVDGDPATSWRTEGYFDQLGPTGLKTGVGLTIDLGSAQEISRIELTLVGAPTEVTYFLTDEEPSAIAGLTALEEVSASRPRVTTDLDEPATGQYLVVWLTSLPAFGNAFRGEIAEVVVSQ